MRTSLKIKARPISFSKFSKKRQAPISQKNLHFASGSFNGNTIHDSIGSRNFLWTNDTWL